MGDVLDLLRCQFGLTPPRKPLTPETRVVAAFHLVRGAEPHLRLDTRVSGFWLIAYTAMVAISHVVGKDAASRAASRMAGLLLRGVSPRDAARAANDDEPRPVA